MEETNGSITFLFQDDGARLEIIDEMSRVRVINIKLTAEDVCSLFSRNCYLPCSIKYGDLSCVGKKLIVDKFIFEMPKHEYKSRNEIAYNEAVKLCPEGWQVDNYFGSKNNFNYKDNKYYCNATIRKWE